MVGFEFPIANRLYLGDEAAGKGNAGLIYGIDLIGSCLGALLVGVLFLPLIGLTGTILALDGAERLRR